LVEAGCRANLTGGRIGRGIRLPPQFGQMPCSTSSAHAAQKVHSQPQMRASVALGGMARGRGRALRLEAFERIWLSRSASPVYRTQVYPLFEKI
jgi:hypothetical protein